MPLPELDSASTCYSALKDADGHVIEIHLEYQDADTGENAEARTWWFPAVTTAQLSGLHWHPLTDRDAALEIATGRRGSAVGHDDLTSLEHRVRQKLARRQSLPGKP